MNSKIVENLENDIVNIAKKLGFDIEYIEFVKENIGNVFRVVLDKENGTVSVDDCEIVSRALEDVVDKKIDVEYVLEVSSPGVERQLKNIKLYKKYEGKDIVVKMYKKQEYGKEFEANLQKVNLEEEIVTLLIDGISYDINLKDIASAHTVYNFSEALKENSDNVNINELKKF